MTRNELCRWLKLSDPQRLEPLWQEADRVRREHVGDAVFLRGLIEISNYCGRDCFYCGLRAHNPTLPRYRMTADEVLESARLAVRLEYGTVVLQSGEDFGLTRAWVSDVVRRIKGETGLAVTLSLGERDEAEWSEWREAGADRYLLRFETSNRRLFDAIHPPRGGRQSDRMAMLQTLHKIGYEVGSGVMIGIPGQSVGDLADDLLAFQSLELDMIGVGPFIPHPDTPIGRGEGPAPLAPDEQVINDELTTYKVLALARLLCPTTNIPSTTALATLNPTDGRELGLRRGANIVMPNITPRRYREMYEIYPGKACVHETAEVCHGCMAHRIESIGRTLGVGRGDSPHKAIRSGGAAPESPAARRDNQFVTLGVPFQTGAGEATAERNRT